MFRICIEQARCRKLETVLLVRANGEISQEEIDSWRINWRERSKIEDDLFEIIKRRVRLSGKRDTFFIASVIFSGAARHRGTTHRRSEKVNWKISRKVAGECSYLSSLLRVSGARQVYESGSRPSRPALHFCDIIFVAVRRARFSPLFRRQFSSDKVAEITGYDGHEDNSSRHSTTFCPFFSFSLFIFPSTATNSPST